MVSTFSFRFPESYVCTTLSVAFHSQRQEMPTLDDDSGSDRDDELPQVVVLQSGDLTAEEAKKIKEEQNPGKGEAVLSSTGWILELCSISRPEVFLNFGPGATYGLQGNPRPHRADPDSFISSTGDDPPADGKILFKKPAKRSSEDKFQGITASSSKKKKNEGGEKTQDEQKEVKSGKKIKNKSLLSFGGDEEEEED